MIKLKNSIFPLFIVFIVVMVGAALWFRFWMMNAFWIPEYIMENCAGLDGDRKYDCVQNGMRYFIFTAIFLLGLIGLLFRSITVKKT